MKKRSAVFEIRRALCLLLPLTAILLTSPPAVAQKQMERLNRGLVAVRTSSSEVYVGWRMFGTDPSNIAFNVYRSSTKVNSTPITNSTNYAPAGGTTPDGVTYTYNANDCSTGDLDGDGQYDIVLKWDPSNAKDNSQSGYTGNVYLDAYKLNGKPQTSNLKPFCLHLQHISPG